MTSLWKVAILLAISGASSAAIEQCGDPIVDSAKFLVDAEEVAKYVDLVSGHGADVYVRIVQYLGPDSSLEAEERRAAIKNAESEQSALRQMLSQQAPQPNGEPPIQ